MSSVRRFDYDVVIVGLGPAGSSLAYMLRGSGLRVAGIDWVGEDRVWGKPCGDAINARHFDRNGLPHPSGDALMQVVDGALVYSPSEGGVIRLVGERAGYIIDRNKYGLMLLGEASKAGVDIYLRTRASHPVIEAGRLVGVRATSEKFGEVEFRARVVVDATGSGGAIRRKLPEEWPIVENPPETDFVVAYRRIVELDYDIDEPNFIRLYFNVDIAPGGYWWFFPKGKRIANIGLGVQLGRGFPNPVTIYKEVLMKRADVGREVRVINEAGARIPTRRPSKTMVWDNFIAIGDSAYTVDPIHGGGMGYAMTAARYAAETIVEAFTNGDFTARGLWGLNLRYMRTTGAKQAALDILRMFLQTLSNDEIEWAIRKGLAGMEEIESVFGEGELKMTPSFLDKVSLVVRFLGKPMLLAKLITVSEYMRRAKSLYMGYPEDPRGLDEWAGRVESLYDEYKRSVGIPF
ncbi:MAG: digeranylgeranylglycerophospholipid reductase [Acidilobaceae archaeon]